MNRPITNSEIEFVIKKQNLPANESPRPDGFMCVCARALRSGASIVSDFSAPLWLHACVCVCARAHVCVCCALGPPPCLTSLHPCGFTRVYVCVCAHVCAHSGASIVSDFSTLLWIHVCVRVCAVLWGLHRV